MPSMPDLFASGAFVDLVLIFLVIETIAIVVWWRWKRRGIAPADFLPGMCSGALMLLALRAVLADAGWALPTICLLAAGVAHLIDVARRWQT